MKWLFICFAVIAALGLSCDEDNPISEGEATDEEAIFNVVMHDYLRLSEMQAFPEEVPDTLAFIAEPSADSTLCWHEVDSTLETLDISISDTPVQSPVGLVDEATVTYVKRWFGSFEILHYNIQGDSLERYSKNFSMTGQRSAKCQKWGNTNQRRGWLLTSISAAHFASGGGYGFLQNLYYHSQSNEDSVFSSALADLDIIPRFDPDEDVMLSYNVQSASDRVYIFIPVNNFNYGLAEPISAGNGFQVQVTMPSISWIYGQLRFYVVYAGDFSRDYQATGYSYNYRIR